MTPTPQERTELQRLAEQATNTELPTPWYDAPSIQQALDDYFGASAAPCNKSDAAYIAAANPAAILDLLSLVAELEAENKRFHHLWKGPR